MLSPLIGDVQNRPRRDTSKPVPMIWKGIIQENMLWLVASLWLAFPPNPNASSEYSSAITKIISQATLPGTWMAEYSQIQWVLKEFPFGNLFLVDWPLFFPA